MLLPAVLAFCIALAVVAVVVGALNLIESRDEMEARLAAYASRPLGVASVEDAEGGPSLAERLNQLVARPKFTENVSAMLARADVPLTVPEFMLLTAGAMSGGAILGILVSRQAISALVLGAAGFYAPRLYLGLRQRQRQRAFEDQLADVLTMLVGALRAGYSFLQSLNVIIEEMPPPASHEFRRVVQEVGLGLSLDEALNNMVRRIDSDDLDLIVTAVNVQREVGGNLATILETISGTLRDRMRIHREIKTITAQQRLTGYVLAFMPFALAGVLLVINPTYMMPMFNTEAAACLPSMICLPIGAVLLVVMGFLAIRQIVSIEV